MTYNNLGISRATVKILNQLPNIRAGRRSLHLNVNASQKALLKNASIFPAIFTHAVIDESTNFSVWHPSKRIKEVDNVLSEGGTDGDVKWFIGSGSEVNSSEWSSAKVIEIIANKRGEEEGEEEGGEEPGENDSPDEFDV